MKRARAPRHRAAPRACSHPARDAAAARSYLASRFAPDDLRWINAFASMSWDDIHAKAPPDARQRERIRAQVAALRESLVQHLAGTTREIFQWDQCTQIRRALDALDGLVAAPESVKEKRLRMLEEDRMKGGMSWWATMVLARAACHVARPLTPADLHVLAVGSGVMRGTTDEDELAQRDALWRQTHARSKRYAREVRAAFADARPAP